MPGPELVRAEGILTGDTRFACEAILCLSSGVRPGECSPALDRYFGITRKTFDATQAARMAFLSLCPASSDPGMPGLVEAIVDGAGRCNAALLNRVLGGRMMTDSTIEQLFGSVPYFVDTVIESMTAETGKRDFIRLYSWCRAGSVNLQRVVEIAKG